MTLGIQRVCKELGFDPGPLDGEWGPRTEAAFKAMMTAALQVSKGPKGDKGDPGKTPTRIAITGEVIEVE